MRAAPLRVTPQAAATTCVVPSALVSDVATVDRPLPPRWQSIPSFLQAQPSWLLWRYEERDGKRTKTPHRVDGRGYAKTTDPATWATFEDAQRAAPGADGVGIVLIDDTVAIDLDHILSEDGDIEPWAAEVMGWFKGAYIERSPSGDGAHIICRGVARRCGKGGPGNRCEVYDRTSPRYITITGHRLGDGDVIEAQDALDRLQATHMAKTPPAKPVAPAKGLAEVLSDEEIIRRASSAANGSKFSRLFSGQGDDDESSNDASFVAMLAFWTRDAEQIDRIVRRSGLMREKWDSRRGASTYGRQTIDKIMAMPGERFGAALPAAPRESAPAAPTGPFDRAAALKHAGGVLAPQLPERTAQPYPVVALGPLADVCADIAEHGQVEPAMAGQCLLGAASLLVQGLHNVETLNGPRPLSLNLNTLGDSGSGKSTAQHVALREVNEWQRRVGEKYRAELEQWEKDRAKRKKGDDPPAAPASPYRLVRDATVEGLRRELSTGPVSQGLFSDEAAAILSGYGMTAEHRAKTAAVFSGLWDNGHLSVSRITQGRVERNGCRLALHWLIQPQAAFETLGDPLLSALGFWPRFLVAWPAEQAPRKAQPFKPATIASVVSYWKRCRELLEMPCGNDADKALELSLSDEARRLLGETFERLEIHGRRGPMKSIKPFALRGAEQAARVAGVLAAFKGENNVSGDVMRGAISLVAYSLETWRALRDDSSAIDEGASRAMRLLEWLTKQPEQRAKLAAIVNGGPSVVRTKDRRDAAVELLQGHGLIDVSGGDARALPAPSEGADHG